MIIININDTAVETDADITGPVDAAPKVIDISPSLIEVGFQKVITEGDDDYETEIVPVLFAPDDHDKVEKGHLDWFEKGCLAECEKRIKAGWETFCLVGAALSDIKEWELYKDKFASFADYCKDRWKMKDMRKD